VLIGKVVLLLCMLYLAGNNQRIANVDSYFVCNCLFHLGTSGATKSQPPERMKPRYVLIVYLQLLYSLIVADEFCYYDNKIYSSELE